MLWHQLWTHQTQTNKIIAKISVKTLKNTTLKIINKKLKSYKYNKITMLTCKNKQHTQPSTPISNKSIKITQKTFKNNEKPTT